MVWQECLRSLSKVAVAFHSRSRTMLDKTAPPICKKMGKQCTFRFAGHKCRFGLVFAAVVSVSLALQSFSSNAAAQTSETKGSSAAGASNSSNGPTSESINVKDYGAVGDGVTDDTVAFIKALAACAVKGGTCLVPEGTYVISAGGISTGHHKASVVSGVHLKGSGQRASVLKIAGMPTDHFLPCEGDNWSVENLTLDMGDYTPPVGRAAIACKGNNWRVSNCRILKSGRSAIAAFGGSNWFIERNYISRTVPGARPPTIAILVTANAGAWSSHGHVVGNVCDGAGMTITGDNIVVARNEVRRSGSGSGIFVQGLPSTHSPTIIDNVCSGGSSGYDAAQGGRWWSVNGFEVWAPGAVICNNTAHDNDGGGFAIGGESSIVVGNKAYNNGRARPGYAGFNARINLARGTSASHSIFIGNSSYDQDYGYKEQGSGLSDIKQIGNDYNHNRKGPVKTFGAGGQMPVSPEMRNKLRELSESGDLSDGARRALRGFLAR
jgi:pectate lyase-like protein/parallel beta helix pectate lyase-like protein